MMNVSHQNSLLTTKQVAQMLNVCEPTVRKLDIPRIQISDKKLRWRRQDVEDWMRRNASERN